MNPSCSTASKRIVTLRLGHTAARQRHGHSRHHGTAAIPDRRGHTTDIWHPRFDTDGVAVSDDRRQFLLKTAVMRRLDGRLLGHATRLQELRSCRRGTER
jgi:hypothetical protein